MVAAASKGRGIGRGNFYQTVRKRQMFLTHYQDYKTVIPVYRDHIEREHVLRIDWVFHNGYTQEIHIGGMRPLIPTELTLML